MDSEPLSYEFDERLKMSRGISESNDVARILLENIPGVYHVYSAHENNDRDGTDWWGAHESGKVISTDCKVRAEDWSQKPNPRDDLALETWSVVEKRKVGWTRDKSKRTDYVLWLWRDTGRWCLIPFELLCAVFQDKWQEWRKEYQTNRQFTPGRNGQDGYHSECVFVPRKVVWAEIYKKFGGKPTT